jgi:hypothetical protein
MDSEALRQTTVENQKTIENLQKKLTDTTAERDLAKSKVSVTSLTGSWQALLTITKKLC